MSWTSLVIWLLLASSNLTAGKPTDPLATACGYQSCPVPKPGYTNVHLIPHTHDDVGWLKTADQYFYGAKTNIQRAGVQYIIDNVIQELRKDPERRFIYVETAFFTDWWNEQTEDTRSIVRNLVDEGRLEFINGGQVMNDEAATLYTDIIDQIFLNETFGECGRPRVAWHIDPFGHSREQANLFAQMGFDAFFFARIDWVDRDRRHAEKQMEMIWQGSDVLGVQGNIFTGVLYNHYHAPPGFCFDINCSDEPIIDNPKSPDYNVPIKVDTWVNYTNEVSQAYLTENVLYTMGEDFNYQSAKMWYKNMDKLIKYVNARQADGGKLNMFYSTPSCYLQALNRVNIVWPTKSDDFFPYSSDEHAFWTGYFSSRPAIKGMVRSSGKFLQMCKQLHSAAQLGDTSSLDSLRQAMSYAQHHDAVTGTEKQHVTSDYALRLHEGVQACEGVINQALSKLLPLSTIELPQLQFCQLLNVSQCDFMKSNPIFVVNLYNPLPYTVDSIARIPTTPRGYTIIQMNGEHLGFQFLTIPDSVLYTGDATYDMVFLVPNIPPLGTKSLYMRGLAESEPEPEQMARTWSPEPGEPFSIGNDRFRVNFTAGGLIESVTLDGDTVPLTQNLLYYPSMRGKNSNAADRASGAYIFRPNSTDAIPVSNNILNVTLHSGPAIVEEAHIIFNEWASQVVRVYQNDSHVEIQWTVGPIPVNDKVGKEVVNRITTNLKTNGEFYTDSNGRQTLKRQRDYRPTWNFTVTEPVSGNYYPINSHIYLQDAERTLIALVTDRAQGGTSLQDGQIELMIHRRCLDDDAFGVGEALNEPGDDGKGLVVRGTHYLVVRPKDTQSANTRLRPLIQRLTSSPSISFIPTRDSMPVWNSSFLMEKATLRQALPRNVQILTLEPWTDDKILLRLEHLYEPDDDSALASPVTIDLTTLLTDFTVTSAKETTLGGNQWIQDNRRMAWESTGKQSKLYKTSQSRPSNEVPFAALAVLLNPTEIKTYILEVVPKA